MIEVTNRRAIIVHGWADDPSRGWIAWLVRELSDRGINASAPVMPTPKTPKVDVWVEYLNRLVGTINDHTLLIGHSLGVYALLRYLDQYHANQGERLGRLILVAGFAGHERTTRGRTALPEVNFESIRGKVEGIYNIYSDNDDLIPRELSEEMGVALGATNILDPGKGHFAGYHGCDTLESVLSLI